MEIRSIRCCTSTTKTIQLGRPMNLDRPSMKVTASSRWRSLWRRLMREKRKIRIFDCAAAHAAQVHVPGYDPHTYAQNFDQGLMWDDEPDSLSRSFSMRFAAPNTRLVHTDGDVLKRCISDVANNRDVYICVF